MYSLKSIKRNRTGISNVLIIAVVVIVVIAAAAVAIVLSNDNKEESIVAPGTELIYDASLDGVKIASVEYYYAGQNAEEYFMKMTYNYVGSDVAIVMYEVSSKASPEGSKKTGTAEIETMDGLKTLDVWEYQVDTEYGKADVKAYADQSNGMSYKSVIEYGTLGTEVQDLTSYELKWQTSYEESENIGKMFEYSTNVEGIVFSADVVCVADCLDGKYGVLYDFSSFDGPEYYTQSDCFEGLPESALNTEKTMTLKDTIDGDVLTEIWQMTEMDGSVWSFYVEPESHVIYRFDVTTTEMTLLFELDKKPE